MRSSILLLLCGLGALAQEGRLALPATTTAVKVERGWAVAQTGARQLMAFDLREPLSFARTIAVEPGSFEVHSALIVDFSVAPEDVLYVSAYVNFGLGDRRYTLLRYDLHQQAAPRLVPLPDVNCPILAAGEHGVWCLDPNPREARHAPPALYWIAWLGAVRSYPLGLEGDATLGAPRVIAGPVGDRAHLWWTVRRVLLDVEPERGIVRNAPIAVFGQGQAITSFAVAADESVQALLPLRGDSAEALTTTYALAQLDADRRAWRRLLPQAQFVRGAQLTGWGAGRLWIWNRRGHRLETVLREK
jgi:hypothetical protein